MTILYFAQTRRATGLASETLPLAGPLAAPELWRELLGRHPDLVALAPTTRLACNGEFAAPDAVFQPGDEIALIPPVSGG